MLKKKCLRDIPNPFAADIVSRFCVCSTNSLLLLLSDTPTDDGDVRVVGNLSSSNATTALTDAADAAVVVVVLCIFTVVVAAVVVVDVIAGLRVEPVDGGLVAFVVGMVVCGGGGANVGRRVVDGALLGRAEFEVVVDDAVVVLLVVLVVHDVGLLVGALVMPLLVVVDTGLVGLK